MRERPIVVGDRLDTDIEGANAVGCPSLLVFTGVTTVSDLLSAPPALRPTYVGADLGDLLSPQPAPAVTGAVAKCGGWEVERTPHGLVLRRVGADPKPESESAAGIDADALDAIRALCTAWWDLDPSGVAATPDGDDIGLEDADAAADFADPRPDQVPVAAGDDASVRLLGRLRLAG